MQLTQKQESMISRYLRDIAARLDGDLPDQVRERHLRQIQARIYKDLESSPSRAISDEHVSTVLRRAVQSAAPPTQAPTAVKPAASPAPARPIQRTPPPPDAEIPAIWLGVCAFNADRFGVAPWTLRLVTVLLGLFTGPLALFCYLAGYIEFYIGTDADERPPIDYGKLALRIVAPIAVAIGIRWGAYKLLDLIDYAYQRGFREPMPLLGKWDWLAHYDGTFFFLLCASIIPLGILSGLPLANAWEHSMKRLTQAFVALYFMSLSFGIASVLVGIILDRVQLYRL